MRTNLPIVLFLGVALIALGACGGGGGNDDAQLRTDLEAAQAAQAEAEAARKKAEAEAAVAEVARKKAEEEAAEAERQRLVEEAARGEAEDEAEQERLAADEADQERLAAEAEQQRLAEAAEEARQAASRAEARAAFLGLGGSADDGNRVDPGDVSVTPRSGQTAIVTATATDGSTVDFASKRRSSSVPWSITTLSNAGSTHKDDLVVYSDLGGPTQVLITEHETYGAIGYFTDADNINNIKRSLTNDSANPIASARFPGGGGDRTYDHTIDSDLTRDADEPDGDEPDGNKRNDYDTTRFIGTFDGASGNFECTGSCTVAHEGGSIYNLRSGTWTFTTSKTARVPVDDDSYMYFGWWKREQKGDETLFFEMFSGGAHEVTNIIPKPLTGTATYTGRAVGQYAIYQPLGTQTESGSFTARAELTADFGDALSEGTLSGRVTNFSNASDWSVTLKSAGIDTGTVADGNVSWTIAGNTEDGGMWDAQFFSDVEGFTGYPEGVAGTFDAKFDDVGRLVGAFGAHCPTSTCPRN